MLTPDDMDDIDEGIPHWIGVEEKPAPPFQTVQLCVGGKVIVGWNESWGPEEAPAYCSWEKWPEPFISGEGVSHWAPLLRPPA